MAQVMFVAVKKEQTERRTIGAPPESSIRTSTRLPELVLASRTSIPSRTREYGLPGGGPAKQEFVSA